MLEEASKAEDKEWGPLDERLERCTIGEMPAHYVVPNKCILEEEKNHE